MLCRVSFLFRNDPTKNAEDLGYAYLPQEVVTKEAFDAYVAKLKEIDYSGIEMRDEHISRLLRHRRLPHQVSHL